MKSKKQEIVNIILTDIQFHVTEPRKPLPPTRVIEKSLRNKKPGRWFSKNLPKPNKDGALTIPILEDSNLDRYIKKLKSEGKKFRILIPKKGLMVYAGKDTVEHIEAKKKKAFDRVKH